MLIWTVVNNKLGVEMIADNAKKAEEIRNLMNRTTATEWQVVLKRI